VASLITIGHSEDFLYALWLAPLIEIKSITVSQSGAISSRITALLTFKNESLDLYIIKALDLVKRV
jgi:hypothetical protein